MADFKSTFDEDFVTAYAASFQEADPDFDTVGFIERALDGLLDLELKDRVRHVADALRHTLPSSYPDAIDVILTMLDAQPDEVEGWSGFHIWPLTMFVQRHGLEHFDDSIRAMYVLTQRFSAEFAIRPFLQRYTTPTLEILRQWRDDPSEHVRRLVSEGTRTRLPWGPRLHMFIEDPDPIFDLLEGMQADPSLYVRRSVANSLNDLSRDHADRVVAVAARWHEEGEEPTRWLVRHALRTLIKQGHEGALEVLGFGQDVEVEVSDFTATDVVTLGESLEMEVTLTSTSQESQRLVVDFVVHHVKNNGERTPKVFKFKTLELGAGEVRTLSKKHPMRVITTRKYYEGVHRVELTLNGAVVAGQDFDLNV